LHPLPFLRYPPLSAFPLAFGIWHLVIPRIIFPAPAGGFFSLAPQKGEGRARVIPVVTTPTKQLEPCGYL
jgi:hypothetical protein